MLKDNFITQIKPLYTLAVSTHIMIDTFIDKKRVLILVISNFTTKGQEFMHLVICDASSTQVAEKCGHARLKKKKLATDLEPGLNIRFNLTSSFVIHPFLVSCTITTQRNRPYKYMQQILIIFLTFMLPIRAKEMFIDM